MVSKEELSRWAREAYELEQQARELEQQARGILDDPCTGTWDGEIVLSDHNYYGNFYLEKNGNICFEDGEYFRYDEPMLEKYISFLQNGLALMRQFRDENKNRQA